MLYVRGLSSPESSNKMVVIKPNNYSSIDHSKSRSQHVFTCKIFLPPCRLVSLTTRGLQQGGNLPTELGKERNGPMGCKPSSFGDMDRHIPLVNQMPCKPHIVANPIIPVPLSRNHGNNNKKLLCRGDQRTSLECYC